MDKTQRVNSVSLNGGNKTSLFFVLPQNSRSELITKKAISWGYWIGVGEDANKAWSQNCKLMSTLVSSVATAITTPLGGFLAGKLTELVIPKSGRVVSYGITDSQNKELFPGSAVSML